MYKVYPFFLHILLLAVTSITITPKRYTINYDLPLEPQYNLIFQEYKKPLEKYIEYAKSVPGFSILSSISRLFTLFQPKEWNERANMYSRITGIPLEDIIIANISYEIFCTSIIVRNNQGQVFLGRNLDFYGAEFLSPLAYEFNVVKNNKQLYTAAGMIGSIGVLNAIVPGKFSVSINERYASTMMNKILRFSLGYKNPLYYLFEIVENANSYDEALSMMMSNNISSPCYYIISGINPNEGAVIARDYNNVVLVDSLSNDYWFLVQTNYDRNKEDPVDDFRRIPAEKKISNIGRNITYQELYDNVLSQAPSFVLNYTIYTTLQSANENYFNTTVYIEKN
jgi:hypothetical protein